MDGRTDWLWYEINITFFYQKLLYLTCVLGVTQNIAKYPLHHVTYSAMRYIYKKNTIFDLWPCCNVQYPLHHVTYSATKFEVATPNALGGDAITRNVTDAPMDGRTNDGPTLVQN